MLLGHLDKVDLAGMSGWARETEDLARRVELDVYDGDSLILRLVADRRRSDLADANIGDGHYGFWTPLPEALFPHSIHRISVRFRETGADLRNSPQALRTKHCGIDDAFRLWFETSIANAANAALEPIQLTPLLALCANSLSRVLHAQAMLAGRDGAT